MRADNRATARPHKIPHRFFHAPGNATWRADSLRGIEEAKRRGYKWIDTNHLTTRDGVSVCCHWGRPLLHGWRDPKHEIKRTARVRDMTWAQVRRLRLARGGSYRISSSRAILAHAGKLGVGVEFEAKNGHWSEAQTHNLLAYAHEHNARVVMKTISTLGGRRAAHKRLTAFHRAGWTTVVLPRGTRRIPRSWWPVVDHVRGRVWWTGKTAKETSR